MIDRQLRAICQELRVDRTNQRMKRRKPRLCLAGFLQELERGDGLARNLVGGVGSRGRHRISRLSGG